MSGKTKRKKDAQGYEQHPPRCGNCAQFKTGQVGIPGKRPFIPTTCGIGFFAVSPMGICNEWQGRDGTVLERAA